jgi:aspartate aminotransferase
MIVAKGIVDSIEKGSWIRKMFEEGARLKAKFGNDNVYDFSLGNPDVEPPADFFHQTKTLISIDNKGNHGYMPNAGFPFVRKAIADKVRSELDVRIEDANIVMSCGAAGGMNVVFKSILNPGDEVIVIRPYFVEYGFYITNHQGVMKIADSSKDFSLNIESISNQITSRTRAVIINSPNNPTGRVYSEKEIQDLADLLTNNKKTDDPILIISDEPYRDIVYDGIKVPSIMKYYPNTITVTSYSKSLSIPGERIGYIAVSPECYDCDKLLSALIFSNRILGFVNAPALMQRLVAVLKNASIDVAVYKRRREIFMDGLTKAGYEYIRPEGAFYIFCKSPISDDVEFVKRLMDYNVLVVPGSGFGGPGYFRIAYCVSEDTIVRSIPYFEKTLKKQ